jgi:hypothetical protein
MGRTYLMAALAAWLAAGSLPAADLGKIDRTIRKEPAYQSKAPRYGLLVFGPQAADRVWLVLDGDTLYVDRNGNGDLTEPGEKIAAKVSKAQDPAEVGYTFEVGDLAVGGKVHKGLIVNFPRLSLYANNPAFAQFSPLHAALKADPKAMAALVSVEVESSRLKGGGIDGRLSYLAGFYDLDGVLQFADRPADAPIVHFDGPLQVTFYGERPTLRLSRDEDVVLVVGTPGHGPGTLAMLAYEGAIPEKLNPKVEITFPAAAMGDSPVKECYELKQRC